MALFSIQRPFLPTDWQCIWKRKANAYHTPLSKSTDTIFWQVQDPGMHYIAYFGFSLTYHKIQYKKVFFFFAFCPLYQIQTLFYTFSQCTYLHRLLYIQVHPTRLHLNTSWTTRHLVFSHITSEKRYLVPMCTPKIYIWYNLQKRDHGNSSLDLF